MPSGINIQGNVILRCPDCGKAGNALRGIYTYEYGYIRYYADKISKIRLGKKQAKRAYEKIRKSKSVENLPISLSAIDPLLGDLAEEAVKSPEPKSLLKQMGLVLGVIGGLGLAVLTGLEITEKVGLLDEVQEAINSAYHGEKTMEPKIEVTIPAPDSSSGHAKNESNEETNSNKPNTKGENSGNQD